MAPIGAMPFCLVYLHCQRAGRRSVAHRGGAGISAGVLVIVGASHKAYFDAYLDQMHDFELVSVEDVLADPVEQ